MFKLKVSEEEYKTYLERLRLVETTVYDFVITDDKEKCEDDKINIVFNKGNIEKVIKTLDLIVKGDDKYIAGYNEFGQKNVECRNFHYFILEGDDIYGVLTQTKLIVKMKLYELDEYLNHKDFIRVSKYAIVNIGKIDYIRPAMNSKLDLLMNNGDHVEVNRGYYKSFRKALEI
jgi:hypothetical protein